MKNKILVIDVESIGLHGPAFAVGCVLMTFDGEIELEGLYAIKPDSIVTSDLLEDYKWIRDNVQISSVDYNCSSPIELRHRFWQIWLSQKEDTIMAADVNWPVESNFLSDCVNDDLPTFHDTCN